VNAALTGLYTFVSGYVYMDVHKEGTGHLYPFLGEERGKKLQRHLTNFLLEQYYRLECLDARLLFIFLRS
jgi:hypothetical protein